MLPWKHRFFLEGPAADATDAPQPWGLLCNHVMKMISFFSCFHVMEHRWNEIDRGKPKYSGKKTCPSATLSTTNPTMDWSRPSAVTVRRLTAWATARRQRIDYKAAKIIMGWFVSARIGVNKKVIAQYSKRTVLKIETEIVRIWIRGTDHSTWLLANNFTTHTYLISCILLSFLLHLHWSRR
jgi:hypothetical protein